jgi:dephospho-CoA kinase
LIAHNNVPPELVDKILQSQMADSVKRTYADVIIENNASIEELKKSAQEHYQNLMVDI